MQINQGTARAIINWNSFSIGAGNAVTINNGTGATLNRVPNGPASAILGGLSASGTVYLVNPAGVVVGPGGRIVTGGSFVASTRDIADSNFMAGGAQSFQGSSNGKVDNQGQITSTGGNVYLVGRTVQNEGTIRAPTGTAGLAGGQEVLITVDPGGSGPSIYIKAGPGYFQNSGTISAAQAELAAAGGNPMALSGTNSGVVRATGTVLRNGRLWLTAETGGVSNSGQLAAHNADGAGGTVTLQTKQGGMVSLQGNIDASGLAPGTIGGTVELLGELVGVFDNGHIEASGPAGGGTVLVGGNYQGKGPQPNANATYLAPTAAISADATAVGDGGRVILWGNDSNKAYGTISARGGAQSGNGGFVEVSSKNGLSFAGSVDTTAVHGQTGTLLLDPQFLVVATAGGAAYNAGTNNLFANNAAGTNTITPASINTQASNVTLQANTDVTITNAINMTTAGVGITIQAGRSVLINAGIATTNGAISITANDNTALSANRTAGVGNITMAAGTSLNSGTAGINLTIGSSAVAPFNPGNMTLAGVSANNVNLTVPGASTVTQSAAFTVPGTLNVNSGSGTITLGNAGNDFGTVAATTTTGNVAITDANALVMGASSVGGTLGITTAGALTQSGALTVTGVTTIAAGAGNDITLATATNDFSTLAVTTGRNVLLADANALILGTSTVSGTLGVTTNGSLTQSGTVIVSGVTTLAAGAGNDITLATATNNFSTVAVTSGRNVSLRDTNTLDLGASTVSGTLGVTTAGALTQSGTVIVTGVTTLAAGAGNDITLANAGNDFSTVAVTTGRNVALADANALILGTSTVSGTLGVTTNGSLTQSGTLIVTGVTTLAVGAGNDITLATATNNFSTVAVTSGRNVSLQDTNALILGASTVSGTLGVTTNGALTQSGALTVSGVTTLAAGAANAITLNNAGNDFSTVAVTNGLNVALTDANALILGASTVSGTLGVTTGGALTQSGTLIVTGVTTLAAGAGNDISLATATNDFSTVAVTTGRNVLLADANALILGTSTVSGTLGVTTGGALTQSGTLIVTGVTTLAAGAANITLATATNDFSTVAVTSGNNVSLRDTNALDLGASTVSGTLGVTTAGAVTQSGALTVTGVTTLAAGAGNDITLATATNDFSTIAITNGHNVTIDNGGALTVNGFTATGAILLSTELGDLTKTGAITSTAASGGNITLAAGISQPRGTASGGDVKSVAGALTPGAGALVLVYSGAVSTTTLTGFAPASGSGNFRYNRQYLDAVGAPGVGSGPAFILYREQPTVTVTPNAATKVYGSADPIFTFAAVGLQNGDTAAQAGIDNTVITRQPGETVTGGPYLFLPSSSLSQLGYDLSVVNPGGVGLTITPATLTYTANPASRLYGAANPAFSGTVTGFVNGEDQSSATTGTLAFTTPAVATSNVGSYAINGSGLIANNGNYVFVQAAGNATALTITPATLNYTANPASRLYGAANPAFSGTVTGFVNGEDQSSATTGALTFTTPAIATSNVGSYAINGSGLIANNGNYIFVQAAGNATALTINPATLTYTANPANRLYGAADPAFSGTVTGFVNGEDQSSATTGTLAFTTPAIATSNVGSYAINGSGLIANNGNYVFVQAAGNAAALTITPATLTYTANPASRLYGAPDPAFGGTVTGFVNGEDQSSATTGTLAFTTPAIAKSNIGSYPIDGSGLTANNGNYVFVQAAGNATALTITPAALTISAVSDSKTYDGNASSAGVPVTTGLVSGDTVAANQSFDSKNAGPRTLSVDPGYVVSDGNGGANYIVTLQTASGTIVPATLHVAASSNAAKQFGSPDPIFGSAYYTVNPLDLKGGDTASVVTGAMGRAAGESILGSPYLFNQGSLAANANYILAFGNTGDFGLFIVVPSNIQPLPVLPPEDSGIAAIESSQTHCGSTTSSGSASGGAGCGQVGLFFKAGEDAQGPQQFYKNVIASESYFD